MFIVEVEMRAFGKPGEIRKVELPDKDSGLPVDQLLESVFYWGQNDFQPQEHPSVSSGDVVRIGSERYLCCTIGWEKLDKTV